MFLFTPERVKLVRVIDGDTVVVKLDLGFEVWTKKTLRLARINTPETRTKNKETKAKGLEAKGYVTMVLQDALIKVVTYKTGGFGRYLADVWYNDVHLNKELLEKGLAVPYARSK